MWLTKQCCLVCDSCYMCPKQTQLRSVALIVILVLFGGFFVHFFNFFSWVFASLHRNKQTNEKKNNLWLFYLLSSPVIARYGTAIFALPNITDSFQCCTQCYIKSKDDWAVHPSDHEICCNFSWEMHYFRAWKKCRYLINTSSPTFLHFYKIYSIFL